MQSRKHINFLPLVWSKRALQNVSIKAKSLLYNHLLLARCVFCQFWKSFLRNLSSCSTVCEYLEQVKDCKNVWAVRGQKLCGGVRSRLSTCCEVNSELRNYCPTNGVSSRPISAGTGLYGKACAQCPCMHPHLIWTVVHLFQALNSIKKYPLPLTSGQEAKILDHVGMQQLKFRKLPHYYRLVPVLQVRNWLKCWTKDLQSI